MLLRVIDQHGRIFFIILFSFLVVCVLNVFRHFVSEEGGYNWYLYDINIFTL
jgi:hypothetical protein